MNNKKIFKMTILILVFIILTLFISYGIMFYKVKNNFLSAIYNIGRSGNLHIVYTNINENDSDKTETEVFLKDGEGYMNVKSNDSNNIIINKIDEEIVIDKDKNTYSSRKGELYQARGLNLGNVVLNKSLSFLEFTNLNKFEFKNIKKGKYDNKDCYIIKTYDEENLIETTVYVDTKTYIPYKMDTTIMSLTNYDNIKQTKEIINKYTIEYLLIENGTVEKLPEVDLSEYQSINID